MKEFVNNYFRVQADCNGRYYTKDNPQCFAQTLWSMDKSQNSDMTYHQCRVIVALTDGMAMCFDSGKNEAITEKDENGNEYEVRQSGTGVTPDTAMFVEVDTNGVKGPNMAGRDFFYLTLNDKGIVYDEHFDITKKSTWYDDHKSDPYPLGIGMIQSDGWKMKY